MKNVLLVTHFYPSHRGGVEIAAYNTAKNLSESGKLNIIWCAADCDIPPENTLNIKCIPLKSSNIIEKILPFPYPLPLPSAIIILWKNVKKCDVLHIHDFIYKSNILAFIFAKIHGKKIILTQHIGFIQYKSKILRVILTLLNKSLGKYIISHADTTVFISKGVMEYFRKFVSKGNFHFLPNSTDFDIYKVYKPEEREKLRKKYNFTKFTFLFVGRFTEKKGLPVIRQVASHFNEYDFIFAGWGAVNPEEWNLPNVRVMSGLQGREIADLYNAADILILPSYGEGFPLVVQEALACGLDLLVSDEIVNAFPEIRKFVSVEYTAKEPETEFFNKIRKNINLYSYNNRLIKSEFAKLHWHPKNNTLKYLELIYC